MSFFKKNTPFINQSGKEVRRRRNQAGNVFAMLFGAVAMVGVVGASTMTVMRGPVKSMSQVTKRTIAENNMMVTAKLAVISVANLPTGDCDGDGTTEAPGYSAPTIATTNGGSIPSSVGVSKQDPWGQEFVYCSWDHGTDNDQTCGAATGYLQGDSVASPSEFAVAVISAGPDGNYQTTCNNYTGPNSLITRTAGSDDIIFGYTFQEASIVAGGLWTEGGSGEAEIQRDLVVTDGTTEQFNFSLGSQTLTVGDGASGTGKFPSVNAGFITGYGGTAGVDSVDIALGAGFISNDGDNEGLSIDAIGNVTGSGTITANSLASSTTLGVTGAATVGSLSAGSGAITTTGTLSTGNADVGTLDTTGAITTGGNIILGSNFLSGDGGNEGISIDASGNVTASNNLDVTGTFTPNTLAVTNNATVGGTLGVTGITTLGTLNAGATSLGGNLAMGANTITGLAAPSAADDAATKNYVDSTIAGVTGTNESDPQVGDVSTAGNYCISDGDSVECTVVTPPGDDLGNHTATTDLDMGGQNINNMAGPTLASDGATKGYVDGAVAAAAGNDDKIMDADGDTQIQVEETADEDVIRFDTAGLQRMRIEADGNVLFNSDYVVDDQSEDVFRVDSTYAPATAALMTANQNFDGIYFSGSGYANEDVPGGFVFTQRGMLADISWDASNTGANGGNTTGIQGIARQEGSGIARTLRGGIAIASLDSTGSVTTAIGLVGQARTLGNGTITSAYGVDASVKTEGTGTITTAIGVDSAIIEDLGGIITQGEAFRANCDDADTCYGLRIFAGDPEVLAGQDWGIYSVGEDANYLSGSLGVGDATPEDGSGSGGQLLKIDVAGAIGTSHICDEDGLNCTTPSAIALAAGGGTDQIADADGDTLIQVEESADEDFIRFDTAGTERMVISNTGNVGIGLTNPTLAALMIATEVAGKTEIRLENTTGGITGVGIYADNTGLNFEQYNGGRDFVFTNGDLAVDTNTLFVDATNNRVGIGTTTPDNSLHISDNSPTLLTINRTAADRQATIEFKNNNGSMFAGLSDSTSDVMGWAVGTGTALHIGSMFFIEEPTGNIGVSTSHPEASAILDVTATDKGFLPPRVSDPTTDITSPATGLIAYDITDDELQVFDGTNWVAMSGDGATVNTLIDTDNDTQIQVEESADDDTIRFDTAGIERMRINASGNIGIGAITNPATALEIRQQYGIYGSAFNMNNYSAMMGCGFQSNECQTLARTAGFAVSNNANSYYMEHRASAHMFFADPTAATPTVIIDPLNLEFTNDFTVQGNSYFSDSMGIGTTTPSASALLEVSATDKGFLPPRVSDPNADITAPATGLIAYDITDDELQVFDGTSWVTLNTTASTTALELVDADNDTKIQVEEGADDDTIRFDTAGTERMIIDPNGNIGIGKNAPTANLEISETTDEKTDIYLSNTNSGATAEAQIHVENDGGASLRLGVRSSGHSFNYDSGTISGSNSAFFTTDSSNAPDNFFLGSTGGTPVHLNYFNKPRISIVSQGKVGIGTTTPSASALLEVSAIDKGFLPPRVSDPSADITAPATGLIAYDITDDELQVFDGTSWVTLNTTASTTALELVDADNDTKIQVEEGADDDTIRFDTAGTERATIDAAGVFNTTTYFNFDNGSTSQTLFTYKDENDTGTPLRDGFNIRFDNDFFAAAQDAVVFEKTDSNNPDPDGGFVFATRGNDGVRENALIIRGDNNVGIGTDTPASPLTVNAGVVGSTDASGLRIERTVGSNQYTDFTQGSSGAFLRSHTAVGNAKGLILESTTDIANTPPTTGDTFIALKVQGNPVMRLTSDEEVGIGTAIPSDGSGSGGQNLKLDVEGAIGTTHICDENGLNCTTPSAIAGATGGNVDEITDADGNTKVQVEEGANDDIIRFDTAGTERMIIDASGNVGIGTTTPNVDLDVQGIIASSQNNPGIGFVDNDGTIGSRAFYLSINTDEDFIIQARNDDFSTGGGDLFKIERDVGTNGFDALKLTNAGVTFAKFDYLTEQFSLGTESPSASALLEISTTDKGFLPPRISDPATAILSPATGLVAYDITDDELQVFDGTSWVAMNTVPANAINDLTDGKTDSSSVFLGGGAGANDDGTANNNVALGINALNLNISGQDNVAIGRQALEANTADDNTAVGLLALSDNTTGFDNTAVGSTALSTNIDGQSNSALGVSALFSNTSGSYNTAIGWVALGFNTTGNDNTAVGYNALRLNATGYSNTAIGNGSLYTNNDGYYNVGIGQGSLYFNTSGYQNTGVGISTLGSNTTGIDNSAVGYQALFANTTGQGNAASGFQALNANTTADYNSAMGRRALYANTTGYSNTAMGESALRENTVGYQNTAIGRLSMYTNVAGSRNTAVGYEAMRYANDDITAADTQNTALGYRALRGSLTASANTGTINTAIGAQSLRDLTSGTANTALGYLALADTTTANDNTAVGRSAFNNTLTGSNNTGMGVYSGNNNTIGAGNTAIGNRALFGNIDGNDNTALGYTAGRYINAGTDNTQATASVFIGHDTRANAIGETNQIVIGTEARGIGSNSIVLGNDSIVTTALKGNVGIGDITPDDGSGSGGQALKLDVEGAVGLTHLCDENGLNCTTPAAIAGATGGTIDEISDADTDTKIQVEETADDDTIRFDTAGAERMVIESDGRIGIGGAPFATTSLTSQIYGTPENWKNSVTGYAFTSGSSASYNGTVGVSGYAETSATGAGTTEAYGLFGKADGTNDTTTQYVYGMLGQTETFDTDIGYALAARDSDASTGGTAYGLYIDMDDTDVTRYGVYQASDNINYFAGNVGIGTTSPDVPLIVAENVAGTPTESTVRIVNENTNANSQVRLSLERGIDSGTGVAKGSVFASTSAATAIGDYEARDIKFFTDTTTGSALVRMTIKNDGHIGIGTETPSASALLDVSATDKGFLPPRVSDPATAITAPATGLVAYDTATDELQVFDGTSWVVMNGGADNLGNHTATTDLDMGTNQINLTKSPAVGPSINFASSGSIAAGGALSINIDSNNNSTNDALIIKRNSLISTAEEVFKVSESGIISFSSVTGAAAPTK